MTRFHRSLRAAALLGAALGGGVLAAATLKSFSMDAENASGSEKYVITGKAPGTYEADTFFKRLEDDDRDVTMKFRVASTLVTYDVAAPRKVLRSVKTSTRQLLVLDTQGNSSFSERYHLGMSVAAKGVPGRFVFCEASADTLAPMTEAIAICDSLTVKKK
ncbi:hypothetical protein GO986_07350 [Deinococcus sp. HMF7620]|uniref:Uncharacterized protein n=1 Tax=Deinococcus arboris TaxID=2682977 RepID=A0A7C9M826_9DEIO|nr:MULTISPECIES: hypothetical protein [Deinococcus]MBZ9752951.1 hypothetical protein [Deinococcus betulae]MVN86579.1 hypothetical protein [Deinococcus arboris]